MATTNNNNTIDEDNSNTPTLAQMTILPNNDHQLQPWLTPLPASSSSSSSASSYSSSSSSSSSLSSPSSSSSSSPSYQPLEPDTISSSSSLCLPQPSNILLPKTTTQASFRLPGPALSHPFLNLSSAISLNPPPNFATVAPGLFRSSFPKPEHFEFLAKLKLRTILSVFLSFLFFSFFFSDNLTNIFCLCKNFGSGTLPYRTR